MSMKTEKTIIEIIRSEILRGKVSRYRIYKDTGINQTALYRIMQGSDITSETAGKLLRYFGYEIRKRKG